MIVSAPSAAMDYLPIFLNVRERPCLLVGGGEVAARKAALLLAAGARVTVVAPVLGPTLARLRAEGKVAHRAAAFEPAALEGALLAFAATDDEAVNRAVYEAATARGIGVNVVDRPDLCTFVMPAIVSRPPVTVALSSGGRSPILARLLRARLESMLPAAYGRLAALAGEFRRRVKERIRDPVARRRFWESVLDGPVAEKVLGGREQEGRALLERALDAAALGAPPPGAVYLVGAGPGDPDLLTFRGLRLLQQADTVVYDRLVSPAVLALARREAELIHVGKERDHHTLPQEQINRLLVELAKQGKRVVRLKGGDPFIFGRGGEEAESLMRAGISFEVVPGITAASGCAAAAGIPLTHRDYAHSVLFTTGHLQAGTLDLNWTALLQPQQTLVFYMGLVALRPIFAELIRRGRAPETPAALIQQGTTPKQRVLVGTLVSLPDLVERASVEPPTLIIVGDVVRLRATPGEPVPTG